jgi:hypothetical protein
MRCSMARSDVLRCARDTRTDSLRTRPVPSLMSLGFMRHGGEPAVTVGRWSRPTAEIAREVEMRGLWTVPFAMAVLCLAADCPVARAVPVSAQPLGVAAQGSDVILAQDRGDRRGGVGVRGPRDGVAVHGPRGNGAVRGPYRGGARVVGSRYYGGTWYGTGRRYWHGRWWPYGIGSCWRNSPIGFVWVCG